MSEVKVSEKFLSAKQVRDRYGVADSTVAIWNRDGNLPAPHLVGGLNMWRLADLEQWETSGCPSSSVLAGELCADQSAGLPCQVLNPNGEQF